jgi:hypothetical protein
MIIELPDPSIVRETFAYLLTTGAAIVTTILLLRRRVSRDKVEVTKDRQEVDIYAVQSSEIRALRDQVSVLSRERNDAMRELGSSGAKVEMFTSLLAEMRLEQRTNAHDVKMKLTERAGELDGKLEKNLTLTGQAVERADAAYKEANTVNNKIAEIGLQMKDGSRLAPSEPM